MIPSTTASGPAARRRILVSWIEDRVGDDAELPAKALPDCPPMGKRLLQDDGSRPRCLRRDDVVLVREMIVRVEPDAVVTASGRHEADVIVLATGFRAHELLAPMDVTGRGGVRRLAHDPPRRPRAVPLRVTARPARTSPAQDRA
ncbi:hypothetical protein LO772_35130 [Yinghuangia sp. ASG 101]|uniref:hypothetical protein n=1 Tax=Yinghuangia sp. ASG 101 TaxID=2896848 RepID=UPI001E5D0CD8|nr:hypothetical protein [Yinghuangia sp. ASG 101]UGQ11933.1 hypothetical protein LO772_35130 [Yinghuangia sp. ASG 101]